jgi:protein SCO1
MRVMAKIICPVLAFIFTQIAFPQGGLMGETVIGVVEKLGETVPGDIRIYDENGEPVYLEDIVDKPTIMTLVYYRCPGICSPLMEGVAEAIDRTDLVLGEDFQVLTISFDARETTDLAVNKKRNHLVLMKKQEAAADHWKFFTSDSANIARLTDATGFRYRKAGNDFIHSATLIVLSPERKISRYLNGTYFLPFEVKMAVLEASEGRVGPTVNKILQFCYSFDPAAQTYVLNITKVTAIIIIFFSVVLFLGLSIKPISRKIRNVS